MLFQVILLLKVTPKVSLTTQVSNNKFTTIKCIRIQNMTRAFFKIKAMERHLLKSQRQTVVTKWLAPDRTQMSL